MRNLRFLALFFIVSTAFGGCLIVYGGDEPLPSLEMVNNYHLPVNIIHVFNDSPGVFITHNYYGDLDIPQGSSSIFELYFNRPSIADVKVTFADEYDVLTIQFNPGKKTTLTLNENGILEL